jgi:hypothetical protein
LTISECAKERFAGFPARNGIFDDHIAERCTEVCSSR